MPDSTTFSTRSNAKRAAEKAIHDGTAPSIDYKLHAREDGRIEIVWDRQDGTEEVDLMANHETAKAVIADASPYDRDGAINPTPPAPASPVAIEENGSAEDKPAETWDDTLTKAEADGWPDSEADSEETDEADEAEDNGFGPDPWPPGARVRVALGKRRTRLGTVDYQTDHTHWRVFLDGGVPVSNLYSGDQLSAPGDDVPAAASAKKERGPLATHAGRPSKAAELDAAAARGVMPEKPICTSEANKAQYQPRFDHLAERAAAADWEAVRNYEVKGINSYAKMVKQYRDRLLAAHEASQKEEAA